MNHYKTPHCPTSSVGTWFFLWFWTPPCKKQPLHVPIFGNLPDCALWNSESVNSIILFNPQCFSSKICTNRNLPPACITTLTPCEEMESESSLLLTTLPDQSFIFLSSLEVSILDYHIISLGNWFSLHDIICFYPSRLAPRPLWFPTTELLSWLFQYSSSFHYHVLPTMQPPLLKCLIHPSSDTHSLGQILNLTNTHNSESTIYYNSSIHTTSSISKLSRWLPTIPHCFFTLTKVPWQHPFSMELHLLIGSLLWTYSPVLSSFPYTKLFRQTKTLV